MKKTKPTLPRPLRGRGLAPAVAAAAALALVPPPSEALNCSQICQLSGLYFKLHYSHREFDDALSERTLEGLLKALDPSKLYFLQEDYLGFVDTYGKAVDDQVKARQCGALNDVLQTYARRFEARQASIHAWIDADHDFTLEEWYEVDLKAREFAPDEAALDERWRKQIKYQLLRLKRTFGGLEEAREKLHKRYRLSKQFLEDLTAVEVASIFLNAFSTSLDPHSKYYSPNDLEDFRIKMGLSLEGIGATLRSEYGITTVIDLVPGGPAQKSGLLRVGDQILAVAQAEGEPVDIVDMHLRKAVDFIRGKRGTEVRLTIEREEKDKRVQSVVSLIRDTIELKDKEAKAYRYPVEVEGRAGAGRGRTLQLGLVKLPSFYIDFEGRKRREPDYKKSSADLRRLIGELSDSGAGGLDGLVIDLRGNTGGSLDEAVDIAGLFFDSGPVVQVRDAKGQTEVKEDRDGETVYGGPLVLLINRQSASASEILAGAIQDYGRGLVVGDSHTFGKGTVQSVKQIPAATGKFGAVKATISQFFRPSGSSTQVRGVAADVVLPDLVDELKIGEKFRDHHLPWTEIDPVPHEREGRVAPQLERVRVASAARVAADPDFEKVRRDIEEYRAKREERKRVSLMEEAEEEAVKGEGDAEAAAREEGEDKGEPDAVAAGVKEEDERPDLEKDYHLRETLRIAADYVQLLAGRPQGAIRFPELEVNLAEGAAAAGAGE